MLSNRLSVEDFSNGLFWDINPDTLDCDKHIKYIVGRVLEAGTLADWNLLCRSLSLQGIVQIARKMRSIDKKSLNFLSVVSEMPKEQFRCFTPIPSMSTHWIS